MTRWLLSSRSTSELPPTELPALPVQPVPGLGGFVPLADSSDAAKVITIRHSITSSAAINRPADGVKPSVCAVLMLRAVSYFDGVCTGRLAGLAPRKI